MLPAGAFLNHSSSTTEDFKTFWYCRPFSAWPDALAIIEIILDVTSFLLNGFTGALLLRRLKRGPMVSLGLLRILVACCFLACLQNLLQDTNPKGLAIENAAFNTLVCVFWHSRLIYWLFTVIGIQAVAFFAVDRAIVLRNFETFRFTAPNRRLVYYQVFIYIFSVLLVAPQGLTVNLQEGKCSCAPHLVSNPYMTVIFAHIYVWFVLLFVVDGCALLAAATHVIIWVKETPLKLQQDDLNRLSFSAEEEEGEQEVAEVSRRGWWTSSMCLLPLACAYVLTFAYDAIYQFISAVSSLSYVINSFEQRIGDFMLVIYLNVVPIVLLIYLPPLRYFVRKIFKTMLLKMRTLEAKDAEEQGQANDEILRTSIHTLN